MNRYALLIAWICCGIVAAGFHNKFDRVALPDYPLGMCIADIAVGVAFGPIGIPPLFGPISDMGWSLKC